MPFEHAISLFEILRLLVEMFGMYEFYEKANLIHECKNVIKGLGVFDDP